LQYVRICVKEAVKMVITMTSKNQITIPKKITDVLDLKKGAMFSIEVAKNRIELIPLEPREKIFSEDVYMKLDQLAVNERGKELPLNRKAVKKLFRK